MQASSNSLLGDARIAILGAGPTGLGAANRLREIGLSNFVIYEQENHAGGLATSFLDAQGFTWDIGGHIQFSHYRYFDQLMDSLLSEQWIYHERESWIWIRDVFVPYPFQNNIRYLPKAEMTDCLKGLIRVVTNRNGHHPTNFEEWIHHSFGEGIARSFLLPYNFKVWAYPPRELSFSWVGERVAKVDLERVVMNVLEARDDAGWGPNNQFRYPLRGGTGEIWRRLADRLEPPQLQFGKKLIRLNTRQRELTFADGSAAGYDILISSIPLDLLIRFSDLDHLVGAAARLRHSSVHVIGVGLRGRPPAHLKTKCWMYFPEDTSPFYRATVFSNYSPHNVPEGGYWSLMLEVSESPAKPVACSALEDQVIEGLVSTRLIDSPKDIVDTWHYRAAHGYPTPSLERDEALAVLLPELAARGIYSRGRFGAWKYEVSNQDHSLMQGVELIDALAGGGKELTLNDPGFVNSRPKG